MKGTKIQRRAAALVLSAGLLLSIVQPLAAPVYASVPKLEQIRVALNLESGKLKSSFQAVTMSSAKGLNLTIKSGAVLIPWPTSLPLSSSVVSAADQYGVLMLETGDFTRAQALRDQLLKQGTPTYMVRQDLAGKPVYQVTATGYQTKELAQGAFTALLQQPAIAPLADKGATLQGPLYWSAGTFAAAAEALTQRVALNQAGVWAEVVVSVMPDGGLTYSVWTGGAADQEALQRMKTEAEKKLPTLKLVAADLTMPYVITRGDFTSTVQASASPGTLLLFSAQGLSLRFTPLEGETTVKERSSRTYRGAVEVLVHNGRLGVINELPLEEYLYSVVSKEMGKGWPQEALKAQAVAARTFAVQGGLKYQVAHVSDTTQDQAYDGDEDADSIQAVEATKGEVLLHNGKLITAFYSSNAGGMSSNGADVWGNVVPYLKVAPSPDEAAAKNRFMWRRGVLPDGQVGYIRSDYLRLMSQTSPMGLPQYQVTNDGVNARLAPYVDNTANAPIAKLNNGNVITVFDEVLENNAYSWFRGPFTADKLKQDLNTQLAGADQISGVLESLLVTKRGESGRVTEVTANGKVVKASSPDAYRSIFGGLPSTRFEIHRSGGYTIQGANGISTSTSSSTTALYALSGSGQVQQVTGSHYFVLTGDNKVRYASRDTQFTLVGQGYGHGLGMSQWGARSLAEMGYDYNQILAYYYEGVTLTKE